MAYTCFKIVELVVINVIILVSLGGKGGELIEEHISHTKDNSSNAN